MDAPSTDDRRCSPHGWGRGGGGGGRGRGGFGAMRGWGRGGRGWGFHGPPVDTPDAVDPAQPPPPTAAVDRPPSPPLSPELSSSAPTPPFPLPAEPELCRRRPSFVSRLFQHKAAHPSSAVLYPPSALFSPPPATTTPSPRLPYDAPSTLHPYPFPVAPTTPTSTNPHCSTTRQNMCALLKLFQHTHHPFQPHPTPPQHPSHAAPAHPYMAATVPVPMPFPPSPSPPPSSLGPSNLHRSLSQSEYPKLNHSYAPPPPRPSPIPDPTYTLMSPSSGAEPPTPTLLRTRTDPTPPSPSPRSPSPPFPSPPFPSPHDRATSLPPPSHDPPPPSPPPPPTPSLSSTSLTFLTTPLSTWTFLNVWTWLHHINLPSYPTFYHRSIDGDMLADMTDEDLQQEMGVGDKFHRGKILKRVKELMAGGAGEKEGGAVLEEKAERKAAPAVVSARHHRHRRGHRTSPHTHERELPSHSDGQSRVFRTGQRTGRGSGGEVESDDVEYYVDAVQVYEVVGPLRDREQLEQWEAKVQNGSWGRGQSSPSALTDDAPDTQRGAEGKGRDSPISSSGSDDEAEEEERAKWRSERHRRLAHRRTHDKATPHTPQLHHAQSSPVPGPHPHELRLSSSPSSPQLPPSAAMSTAFTAPPETKGLLDTVSATFAALAPPSTGLTSSPSHPQLPSKRASASLYPPPPQPVHPSHSDTSLSSSLPHAPHHPVQPSPHTPQAHHSASSSPSSHPSLHHHSASLPSPPSSVPSRIDRLSSTLTTHPTFIDEVTSLTILNEGVAGHAYRGTYHSLPVVVKLPKSLEISGQEWREWQAHLRLPPHRHLVQFLGALVMQENNYLVTALIKQGSLKGVLTGEGGELYRRPYGVMKAALEIGMGLSHMHKHRIVHRDISSRNILVDSDGTFIIADLGLCREMGKALEPSPEDSYEMGRSTAIPIRWTAPEALLSSSYTAKTDVWSLGVTLWEMTTAGRVPYAEVEGGNRRLISAMINGEVELEMDEDWGEAGGDDDGGLGWRARKVVESCLRREVDGRPNSVELVDLVDRELREWEREGGAEVERVKGEWAEYHRVLDERLTREMREEEEQARGAETSVNGRLVSVLEVSESRAVAAEEDL